MCEGVRCPRGQPAAAPAGTRPAPDGAGRGPGPGGQGVSGVRPGGCGREGGRTGPRLHPVVSDRPGARSVPRDERKESSLDVIRAVQRRQLPGSRRWAWTCGSPTPTRCGPTWTTPRQDRLRQVPHHEERGHRGRQRTQQENRTLVASGDKSLTGSKYLWLYSAENLPERHQSRFNELRSGDLKTSRVWAIKENLGSSGTTGVEAGPRSLEELVLLGHPLHWT